MNMICSETSTCQCREGMQWNTETLECQVFMVSIIGVPKNVSYKIVFVTECELC